MVPKELVCTASDEYLQQEKKGIFSNQQDNLEGLKRSLHQRFKDVSIEVVGCAALFSGRVL